MLAVAPQELQMQLQTLALNGVPLNNIFTQRADSQGLTEKGRALREKELQRTATMSLMVQVSQERLAEFTRKLEAMERASYEALIENEEKLRDARQELERIREKAYEVTMPDGTVTKVYRDEDKVRDDDGGFVSRDVVKAEEIPDSMPSWRMRERGGELVNQLAEERESILKYRKQLDTAREESASGDLDEPALKKLEAAVDDVPASVRRHMAQPPENDAPGAGTTRFGPSASVPGPT